MKWLVILMLTHFVIPCAAQIHHKQKGDRILGVAVNESPNVDYSTALKIARKTGLNMVSLPIPWDAIETSPGKYLPNPNFLAIANAYYPARGLKVAVEINPVDTNQLRVPEYLASKPFDHPEVIAAFKKLLDYVFSQIPDLEMLSLTIGNEVDGFLHSPQTQQAYIRFFQEAAGYARSKRENLVVGVKAMHYGLTKNQRDWLQLLNQHSDVVMVTYYPLNSDFTLTELSNVSKDIEKLLQTYPERTIYLSEFGVPSGRVVRSSQKKQAEYIAEIFRTWDDFADHLKLIEFTWLHDQSPEMVGHFEQYYGLSDERFVDFLATLGLRTIHGENKMAFTELVRQARARGW